MEHSPIIHSTVAVDNRPVHCRVLVPSDAVRTPVLMLHGLGCSSAVWMPALSALERLGAGRMAIAADFPGCGHSADGPEPLNIRELALWCVRLLDRFDIPVTHLGAHSMGCQVALAMARLAPERTGAIVLVGPTLGSDVVLPWRYALGLFADLFVENVLYNGLLAKMYCEMGVARYCATTLKMFSDRPLAFAQQIASPTLILRGDHDAIVPDTSARRLAAALPRGAFERVPRSAHAVVFNRAEFFAARLERFLATVEADRISQSSPTETPALPVAHARLSPKIRDFKGARSIREESKL